MTPGSGTVKKNVRQFDDDVREGGSYAYTMDRLSCRVANSHISESIGSAYDFSGRSVLDLGCGDGAYTVELAGCGAREVVGIDPAALAIEAARARAASLGLESRVSFEVGNVYDLEGRLSEGRFDCVVLRGVLHHLPDPARAVAGLGPFPGTVIVLEPNGYNPVVKLLERFSRYHVEHEERSFTPCRIRSWLSRAGFRVRSTRMITLVPMFCPDWMARCLSFLQPFVERLPLIRLFVCGQSLIVAGKE